jgi:hypothetical protein
MNSSGSILGTLMVGSKHNRNQLKGFEFPPIGGVVYILLILEFAHHYFFFFLFACRDKNINLPQCTCSLAEHGQ